MYDGSQLLVFGGMMLALGLVVGRYWMPVKQPWFWNDCHICGHRFNNKHEPECPRCGCPTPAPTWDDR